MKTKILFAALLALVAHCAFTGVQPVHAALLGPSTPYLSFADSPFSAVDFSAGYFHLEDFEDGVLNTAGVGLTSGFGSVAVSLPPFAVNSVDADDGAIDGNGLGMYFNGFIAGFPDVFTFDSKVLGNLPTHVGIVATASVDAAPPNVEGVWMEAFDEGGASLGTLYSGAGWGLSTAADDRFMGFTNSGGISKIVLSSWNNNYGMDHLQYGLVPEPSSLALMGLGMAGLGAVVWRRRNRRQS